jgi:hypothetical protein
MRAKECSGYVRDVPEDTTGLMLRFPVGPQAITQAPGLSDVDDPGWIKAADPAERTTTTNDIDTRSRGSILPSFIKRFNKKGSPQGKFIRVSSRASNAGHEPLPEREAQRTL